MGRFVAAIDLLEPLPPKPTARTSTARASLTRPARARPELPSAELPPSRKRVSTLVAPQLVAEFSVDGIPRPQGSMRAFVPKGGRRAYLTSDNPKTRPWKTDVAAAARAGKLVIWQGPVAVGITFRLPRPKGHVGKSGLLPSAPHHPAVKPDLDKLARAVLDALVEAGVIVDDSLVVRLAARKVYGEPGASVRVMAEVTP
jgi:Holliday junction resolvase RusA-like endonuclease